MSLRAKDDWDRLSCASLFAICSSFSIFDSCILLFWIKDFWVANNCVRSTVSTVSWSGIESNTLVRIGVAIVNLGGRVLCWVDFMKVKKDKKNYNVFFHFL